MEAHEVVGKFIHGIQLTPRKSALQQENNKYHDDDDDDDDDDEDDDSDTDV